MMDALQKIIEREAQEGIESLSWLEVTIHGAYWRRRHEPTHPGLVEAAAQLARLEAVATAAREVYARRRMMVFSDAVENLDPELDAMADALAALEGAKE